MFRFFVSVFGAYGVETRVNGRSLSIAYIFVGMCTASLRSKAAVVGVYIKD